MFLYLLLLPSVCGEFVIENFLVTASPQYFKNITVTTHPNGSIDLYGELVKVLEGRILVSSERVQKYVFLSIA
jgi:hypothetical protein